MPEDLAKVGQPESAAPAELMKKAKVTIELKIELQSVSAPTRRDPHVQRTVGGPATPSQTAGVINKVRVIQRCAYGLRDEE